MIDKQIDPVGWRDAKIAELEEAIREFACTGTDEPCGCYRLLSQEKTEISRLQEAKRRALAIADERSKENAALRQALRDFLDAYLADVNPNDRNETAIEHARRHLEQRADDADVRS